MTAWVMEEQCTHGNTTHPVTDNGNEGPAEPEQGQANVTARTRTTKSGEMWTFLDTHCSDLILGGLPHCSFIDKFLKPRFSHVI